VGAGLLALATLLQAYCHVGDRDAVELTVMDKRWQLVLDCLGAEHPKPRHGILTTSGNLSRLDRAGKNPRLAAPVFPSRICSCTTFCSVL
jgi:transposase